MATIAKQCFYCVEEYERLRALQYIGTYTRLLEQCHDYSMLHITASDIKINTTLCLMYVASSLLIFG